VEAIKLLESPLRAACDQIWVVRADEEEALARLLASRGMAASEARRRLAAQSPEEEKLAAADVVIDNGGSLEATERQVSAALAALLAA
jgi:dephospho-CoA kinase